MLGQDFPRPPISEDGLSVPRREVSGAPPLRKTLTPSHGVSIKLGPPHKDTQRPAMLWRQNVWETAAWLTDAQSIRRDVILTSGNRAPNRPRNNKINGLESKNLMYALSEFPDWLTHCSHPGVSAPGLRFPGPPGGGREWERWIGGQPVTAPSMKQNTIFTQSFFELQQNK